MSPREPSHNGNVSSIDLILILILATQPMDVRISCVRILDHHGFLTLLSMLNAMSLKRNGIIAKSFQNNFFSKPFSCLIYVLLFM